MLFAGTRRGGINEEVEAGSFDLLFFVGYSPPNLRCHQPLRCGIA
jgi:hypothetical protein